MHRVRSGSSKTDWSVQNSHRDSRADDTVDAKVDGRWRKVSIKEALAAKGLGLTDFRCHECHGAVRLHGGSTTGARAHFEHRIAHKGCTRKENSYGHPRRHPKAID